MTAPSPLLQLADELFVGVMRLARAPGNEIHSSSKTSRLSDFGHALLSEYESRHPAMPGLEMAKALLVYFVDYLVLARRDDVAGQWLQSPLAERYGYLNGDERFFEICELCLKDSAPAGHLDALSVALACLRCGFRGVLASDPEALARITQQIRRKLDGQPAVRIELGKHALPTPAQPPPPPPKPAPRPPPRILTPLRLPLACALVALAGYAGLFRLGIAPVVLKWLEESPPPPFGAPDQETSP